MTMQTIQIGKREFVLRALISAPGNNGLRMLYYIARLAIVVFGVIYNAQHHINFGASSFANPAQPSRAGPKTLEFHWSMMQQSQ